MKKIIIAFLLLCFYSQAQNNLYDSLWYNLESSDIVTDANATYLIPIGNGGQGVSLINSDQDLYSFILGAFYTNDEGNLQCGGIETWNNLTTQLSLYGDDQTTDEKDGFDPGEEITWLAYSNIWGTTYNASVTYINGSNFFSGNSMNFIESYILTPQVKGCTDATACNFNEDATNEDGSCEQFDECGICGGNGPEEGYNCDSTCIDSDLDGICNFDETSGCTDSIACNYIPSATEDDNSCNYSLEGYNCDSTCIDTDADEVCDFDEILGCTDSIYIEYNQIATDDDGSCITLIISGCKDSTSFNYNSDANTEDGSCLSEINISFNQLTTNSSINYSIQNSISVMIDSAEITETDLIGGFVIINGQLTCVGYSNWSNNIGVSISLAVDDPETTEIDGLVEGQTIYWIINQGSSGFNYLVDIESIYQFGLNDITSIQINPNISIGCQDSTAFNYNEDATIDDGYCIEIVEGCMDATACNYNVNANIDDGSCYLITISLSNLSVNNPLSITTTANNPTYTWVYGGDTLNETSNEYTPLDGDNGIYIGIVTDDQGCSVSDTVEVNNVNMDELITADQILTYPIPANDFLIIESGDFMIHSMNLISIEGKMMKHFKIDDNQFKMHRNNIPNGVYILDLKLNNKSIKKQIIFE